MLCMVEGRGSETCLIIDDIPGPLRGEFFTFHMNRTFSLSYSLH